MSRFLNKKYWSLKEYTPGEQPQDQQYIKLNTNESPYPPSKSVLDAVNSEEVSRLNLYSDTSPSFILTKLSDFNSFSVLEHMPVFSKSKYAIL